MGQVIRFTAHGVAAPQGSKNQFGGESSKRVKPWREDVARAAGMAMDGQPAFDGPVDVVVRFRFTRPKLHFRANGELKENAPKYVTSRAGGDIDKLLRALADAMTGIVYLDDAQIVSVWADKMYDTNARAEVEVTRLPA
jgi:crossover junction endodeoxyribonuclease RusA